jgi:hypothetical protein
MTQKDRRDGKGLKNKLQVAKVEV